MSRKVDTDNIDENASGGVPGCTDVNAVNYNSSATNDDGSCVYEKQEPTVQNPDSTVTIKFRSNIKDASILQNGVKILNNNTDFEVIYDVKELQTPRIFKAVKENTVSSTEYKVQTILQKKTGQSEEILFFWDVSIEKKNDNGQFEQYRYITPWDGERLRGDIDNIVTSLDFELKQDTPIPPTTGNLTFITKFPTRDFSVSYRLPNGSIQKVPNTRGGTETVKYQFRNEDLILGVIPTVDVYLDKPLSSEFRITKFETVDIAGNRTFTDRGNAVLSPNNTATVTIEIERVPQPQPTIIIDFQNDIAQPNLLSYQLAPNRNFIPILDGVNSVSYQLRENGGNYIQFYQPRGVSEQYNVEFIIQEGRGSKEKRFTEGNFKYDLTNSDVKIKVTLTKKELPKKCNDPNAINFGQEGECIFPTPPKIKINFLENSLYKENVLQWRFPNREGQGFVPNLDSIIEYNLNNSQNYIQFDKTNNFGEFDKVKYTIQKEGKKVETFTIPTFQYELGKENIYVTVEYFKQEPPKCQDVSATNYGEYGDCIYPPKIKINFLENSLYREDRLQYKLPNRTGQGFITNNDLQIDYTIDQDQKNYINFVGNLDNFDKVKYTIQKEGKKVETFTTPNFQYELGKENVFISVEYYKDEPKRCQEIGASNYGEIGDCVFPLKTKIKVKGDGLTESLIKLNLSDGRNIPVKDGETNYEYTIIEGGPNSFKIYSDSNNIDDFKINYNVKQGSKEFKGTQLDFSGELGVEIIEITVDAVKKEPKIIKGCTDPNANNYNPFAKEDDGSCQYTPVSTLTPTSTPIPVRIQTETDISLDESLMLEFSDGRKEFLTNGNKSFTYTIIPNSGTPNYVRIRPVKSLDGYSGNIFVQNGNQVSEYSNFEFQEEIGNQPIFIQTTLTKIPEPPKPTPPPEKVINVNITAQVAQDNLIGFKLSDGQGGNVNNGSISLKYKPDVVKTATNYIKFFRNNEIDYSDYKIEYRIKNGGRERTANVFEIEEELGIFDFDVEIVIDKIVQTPPPEKPTVSVSGNYTFNLYNDNEIRIPFSHQRAELITYTIGDIRRQINPNSSPIVLEKAVFKNGVGQYKLNLQPSSRFGGSGDIVSTVINVIESTFIPGPDIQTINYPATIKGQDFKGFDVDFDVTYSSINTNFVKVYASIASDSFLLIGNAPSSGKVRLNVNQVLRKSKSNYSVNEDKISFDLVFVPYNTEADEVATGRQEKISINFDQGLRIKREDLVKDLRQAFEREFDLSIIAPDTSRFLTHQLHLGNGNNKIISNWAIDSQTFGEESLILKLYDPLPPEIQTENTVWISKIQSIPIIDEILILDEDVTACTPLQPNFNVDISDPVGYEIIDSLVASGSISSTELIAQYVSSSEFTLEELDLQFVTSSDYGTDYYWKDFVKYSSAEERVENFWYKVRVLESYQNDLNRISSGSAWTGSIETVKEKQRTEQKIKQLKGGFDAFEKYLYNTTGSLSYPKTGTTPVSSSNQDALDWLYVARASAIEYDTFNINALVNNIPKHIKNDEKGQEFVLFFNMIGQHFDILWSYTRSLNKTKKLEHKLNDGISNDLLYHMLESLGWDADMGVASQLLWEYAFGENSTGTKVFDIPGKQRQYEIWRRLLNNLPYLLKHKGTKRAMHAAMACYGVPTSMLSVMEFGGPNEPQRSKTQKVTFDDRTAALNFVDTSSLIIPWKEYTSGSYSDHPNSIEARLLTTQRQDQTIFENEGNWSLKITHDTGSLARLQFEITSSGVLEVVSSSTFPFYNDEYTQFVLNRTYSGSNEFFQVWAKEGFQGRIRNEESTSISLPTGSTTWESGSELVVGSNFTGSIDEFRLWTEPLSETNIENHALIPDAIDGNSYSSSTEDLIFRLDFEYPRSLMVSSSSGIPSGSVKNVSINQMYGESYATASNFPSSSQYPYNYTPYDRTVVANVPSMGLTFGEKFRFEEQTKVTELSHKSRATKKSFDQAPTDSERLGLFFSPVKEINMDILKSLGKFNLDNFIGNPADQYNDTYTDLKTLREYYFQRYNLNLYEYIQLVRYIDKTLYTTLESLAPARARVSKGLLIEPHFLERSKTKWERPTGSLEGNETNISILIPVTSSYSINSFESTIPYQEIELNSVLTDISTIITPQVISSMSYDDINGTLIIEDTQLESDNILFESNLQKDEISINSFDLRYETIIDTNDELVIHADKSNFVSTIETPEIIYLSSNKKNYESLIPVNQNLLFITEKVNYNSNLNILNTTQIQSVITINSGSDMGGIVVPINAKIEGNASSEFDSLTLTQVGQGQDSPFVNGFGLYGENGYSIRTFIDKFGNIKKERIKVYKITEQYTQNIRENINPNDSSLGTSVVKNTFTREKITILPFTGSDGLESTTPTPSGNITNVVALNGYFPSHYRYVGDLTTGLLNSYHNGSKQTSTTTIDGSSPVEIFTTNPNTLRVTDTGRGSGEPILEVE